MWHHGQFLIKRNKLTCGTRFGSIEVKTPKQLFKDFFILEKDFFPTSFWIGIGCNSKGTRVIASFSHNAFLIEGEYLPISHQELSVNHRIRDIVSVDTL